MFFLSYLKDEDFSLQATSQSPKIAAPLPLYLVQNSFSGSSKRAINELEFHGNLIGGTEYFFFFGLQSIFYRNFDYENRN